MSHIAVFIIGILSNCVTGITGSLLLSLARGFVPSSSFIVVGGILHDRYQNR